MVDWFRTEVCSEERRVMVGKSSIKSIVRRGRDVIRDLML